MMTGRFGKIVCSSAAQNGWADAQIPLQGTAPPFSSRRARDCTAGAFEMSANNLPVADDDAFCAKQRKFAGGNYLVKRCHRLWEITVCSSPRSKFSNHEPLIIASLRENLRCHSCPGRRAQD